MLNNKLNFLFYHTHFTKQIEWILIERKICKDLEIFRAENIKALFKELEKY